MAREARRGAEAPSALLQKVRAVQGAQSSPAPHVLCLEAALLADCSHYREGGARPFYMKKQQGRISSEAVPSAPMTTPRSSAPRSSRSCTPLRRPSTPVPPEGPPPSVVGASGLQESMGHFGGMAYSPPMLCDQRFQVKVLMALDS